MDQERGEAPFEALAGSDWFPSTHQFFLQEITEKTEKTGPLNHLRVLL